MTGALLYSRLVHCDLRVFLASLPFFLLLLLLLVDGYLIPCFCLVCTGNGDTSQYEVQFSTPDPVHFLPFIPHDFLYFFFFVTSSLFFYLEQSSNKCRPFFSFFSSLITSITGSGSSISLLLSPRLYTSYDVLPFSFSSFYTLPVLSDQTQIPLYPPPVQPCHQNRTQDGPERKWDWYKKEPTQKNQEFLDSTLLSLLVLVC